MKQRQKFQKSKHQRGNQPKQEAPKINVNFWGWHACFEAWRNPERQIHKLYITEKAFEKFESEIYNARKNGLYRPDPIIIDAKALDLSIKGDAVHQGIAMQVGPLQENDLQDLIIAADEGKTVLMMLDQVTDPHNVGAIIRSCAAFGTKGIVMQRKHAPSLDGVLAKTACGGVEHLPVASVTNLSRAIEQLQEAGFVVAGLDERGEASFEAIKKHDKIVLVMGAEGSGMRRLVADHCDMLVSLPTVPPILSLNVSNAAAVSLYAVTA